MRPELGRRLRDSDLVTKIALGAGCAAMASGSLGVNNVEAMMATAPAPAIVKKGGHAIASPLPHFGYDTNKIWVPDTEAALTEAESVAASGADTIRILTPYTVGGTEINNDLSRYCNALYATQEYGLRLEIGLDGHFRDRKIGYFPTQANEMQKLHTELFNLMSNLAGGNCHDPEGNPVKADEFNIGFNEPNYKQRYKLPGMGAKLAHLLIYLAPLLRQDAEKLNVRFNLTGAAITLSEPNDPLEFIKEFDAEIYKKLHPNEPLPFDGFQFNYYAFGQFTADNLDSPSHATSIEKAADTLRADFGDSLPLGISEVGAFSSTPASKEGMYSESVPKTVTPFPGKSQGLFYERVIDLAACAHLDEVEIFHHGDDGNDVLRTGDQFPNGADKPSAPIIREARDKLDSGDVVCK